MCLSTSRSCRLGQPLVRWRPRPSQRRRKSARSRSGRTDGRMSKTLVILGLVASLIGLSMSALAAQESLMVELTAPRALRAGDSIEVQIATGPLPRGSRLVVMTDQGQTIGVVTPFNVPGSGNG